MRALARVPSFARPSPQLEQIRTPPELAADLLLEARQRGDLSGRPVVDLGSGTGTLAIGAALLGARPVYAVEIDPSAADLAERAASALGVSLQPMVGDVSSLAVPEGTVLMNPPFGAQRRRADRPFWDMALRPGHRAVYAFALSRSRSFIEALAVERRATIESVRAVPWRMPYTFPHHRRNAVELSVDRWILRVDGEEA